MSHQLIEKPWLLRFTYLSVHLYAGLAPELPAGEVGVVRGVDVVVRQRLLHVLDKAITHYKDIFYRYCFFLFSIFPIFPLILVCQILNIQEYNSITGNH